jgi:RNA polymerase sigma-70 factor (ECF subfamily)
MNGKGRAGKPGNGTPAGDVEGSIGLGPSSFLKANPIMTLPEPEIARVHSPLAGYAAQGDGELLQGIGRQDREAFRELYDRYSGRLAAYVQAMGRGRISVEDVVQEVLVALWRKAALFRPELGSPEAWIFTITRNKVFDIWRANPAVVDIGELNLEDVMDPTLAPDPTLGLSLGKALAGLPPEQRDPLALAYFGGYSYEETAQRLNVPLGTLKSRIRAGLSRLKHLLGSP